LESAVSSAGSYFNLWVGHYQRNFNLTEKQREIMSRIVNYIACNGACTVKDIREDNISRGVQLIKAFGNMKKADEALQSVFNFVIYRKTA
jgi:type I restriction enzyme R subunit